MINKKKSRILLAEDDPPTREVIAALLSQVGGHDVVVEDGTELLSKLETDSDKYDLVITDINMPFSIRVFCYCNS